MRRIILKLIQSIGSIRGKAWTLPIFTTVCNCLGNQDAQWCSKFPSLGLPLFSVVKIESVQASIRTQKLLHKSKSSIKL